MSMLDEFSPVHGHRRTCAYVDTSRCNCAAILYAMVNDLQQRQAWANTVIPTPTSPPNGWPYDKWTWDEQNGWVNPDGDTGWASENALLNQIRTERKTLAAYRERYRQVDEDYQLLAKHHRILTDRLQVTEAELRDTTANLNSVRGVIATLLTQKRRWWWR